MTAALPHQPRALRVMAPLSQLALAPVFHQVELGVRFHDHPNVRKANCNIVPLSSFVLVCLCAFSLVHCCFCSCPCAHAVFSNTSLCGLPGLRLVMASGLCPRWVLFSTLWQNPYDTAPLEAWRTPGSSPVAPAKLRRFDGEKFQADAAGVLRHQQQLRA